MDENILRGIQERLSLISEQATASRFYNGTISSLDGGAPDGRHVTVIVDNEGMGPVLAHRGRFEPAIGARVSIERIAMSDEYHIVGVATDALASRDPALYDIERPGVALYYPLALEAINRNAYNLSASGLEVTLYNVQWVGANGVFKYLNNIQIDLAGDVPLTDQAWAVLYIDDAADTIGHIVDVAQPDPNTDWIAAVQLATGAGRIPILAIRLDAGMASWPPAWTSISRGFDFANKRVISIPYYQVPSSGGGGGVTAFTQLTDAPADYTGAAGGYVRVNGTEDGLEFDTTPPSGASDFTDLSDVPGDYTGQSGKAVAVNGTEDGLEFIDFPSGGPADFTDLDDVPADYTGAGGEFVRVNNTEDGLEFAPLPAIPADFTDLDDTPSTYTGQAGKVPAVNGGETALEFVDLPGGADAFTDLTDTPAAYTGQAGNLVSVNVGETALEFTTPPVVPESFTDLDDTPSSLSGQGGNLIAVNSAGTALEAIAPPTIPADFTDLGDTPNDYAGQAGKVPAVNAGETALEFIDLPAPPVVPEDFTDLGDVPASYAGQAGLFVAVNSGETGLEFVAGGGGGAITVTDGTTAVNPATTLDLDPDYFAVTDGGSGVAQVSGHGFIETMVRELVYEIELSAVQASIDVTSIPQTGIDIEWQMTARSNTTNIAAATMYVHFNGDTTDANYQTQFDAARSGAAFVASTAGPRHPFITTTGSTTISNVFATHTARLPLYTDTAKRKLVYCEGGMVHTATELVAGNAAFGWVKSTGATDAINRLTFTPQAGSFVAGTLLRLYVTRIVRVPILA